MEKDPEEKKKLPSLEVEIEMSRMGRKGVILVEATTLMLQGLFSQNLLSLYVLLAFFFFPFYFLWAIFFFNSTLRVFQNCLFLVF